MATIASCRPHPAPTAGQVPPSLCSAGSGSRSLHLHTQFLHPFWVSPPQSHLEGDQEATSAQANCKLRDLPIQLHFPNASETVLELPVPCWPSKGKGN